MCDRLVAMQISRVILKFIASGEFADASLSFTKPTVIGFSVEVFYSKWSGHPKRMT